DVLFKHHQNFVESGVTDLLVAFAGLLRLGADQARAFENLQIGRDGRLGQIELLGNVVAVEWAVNMKQFQDLDANRRCKALDDLKSFFGINYKKIAAHLNSRAPTLPVALCITKLEPINPGLRKSDLHSRKSYARRRFAEPAAWFTKSGMLACAPSRPRAGTRSITCGLPPSRSSRT